MGVLTIRNVDDEVIARAQGACQGGITARWKVNFAIC